MMYRITLAQGQLHPPRHDCDQLFGLERVVHHRQRRQREPAVGDGSCHLAVRNVHIGDVLLKKAFIRDK